MKEVLLLFALFVGWVSADGRIKFVHRNLFPESMDWDSKNSRFMLGSMTTGSLYTLYESGGLRNFVTDMEYAGKSATLGVKVDHHRNRVIATVHSSNVSVYDAVVAYDLDTKHRKLLTRLDTILSGHIGRPIANDVAIDGEGNLYVTNSAHNFIWKVSSDGEQVSIFSEDPVFSSRTVETEDELVRPCGLNGIAYHRDNYLLVGQSNTGALYKVNLATGKAIMVQTRLLVGMDGIALREDGALIAVSSSKAWLLRSSDYWRTADVTDELDLERISFATSVAIRDGFKAYVLYSNLLDMRQGVPRSEYTVEKLVFAKDAYDDPMWLIVLLVVAVVLVLGWRFQMSRFLNDYGKKRL